MGMMMNLRRSQMMVTDKDYIQFADPVVAQICADNWGDGIGITYNQAAAVTSIGTVFNGNTEITSFDELQYFTGVTSLVSNAFYSCTSLVSLDLSNIVTTGYRSVAYCSNLQSIKLRDLVTVGEACFREDSIASFVGGLPTTIKSIPYNYSFQNCAGLVGDLSLPNLTSVVPQYGFMGSGVSRVLDLGKITQLRGSAFDSCPNLTTVHLPETLTSLYWSAFKNCNNLTTVVSPATTPPQMTESNAFNNTPIASGTGYIYVPDASVDAYKAATNWSTYADQIIGYDFEKDKPVVEISLPSSQAQVVESNLPVASDITVTVQLSNNTQRALTLASGSNYVQLTNSSYYIAAILSISVTEDDEYIYKF